MEQSFLGSRFNSMSLGKINNNDRNVIRKKKRRTNHFLNFVMLMLDKFFLTRRLQITTPNVNIYACHRLILIGIFHASSYLNDTIFFAKIIHENPTDKLIATKLFGHTLFILDYNVF